MTVTEILSYQASKPLLFSSGLFALLFAGFYALYLALRTRQALRLGWVILFSSFFYYKCSGVFVLLLLGLAMMDYLLAGKIADSSNQSTRRAWLLLSLCGNLGALFYYKYLGLFSQTFGFGTLDIILPAGISFFTFQSLSYTVEVYRREIRVARNLLDYLFFATFFPQLVAGPIVRARQFLPQIAKPFSLSQAQFGRAWFLIMAGLFKKAVISDYISVNFVDRVFDNPGLYTGLENLSAVYAYALQIYCDFSGYSDMAIGLALLMGFELPLNFNAPYQSATLSEFWRRWHISLSTWLRDYLYIPMGGSKNGKLRTYINLGLTMLLGGLWHGASWKFLLWGAWHGFWLAVERAFGFQWKGLAGKLLTFHLVCLGWVYFRADSFEAGNLVLGKIFNGIEVLHVAELVSAYSGVFALMALGYLLHFTPAGMDSWVQSRIEASPWWGKALMMLALILLVIQVQSAEIQPFIYFQF